MIKVIKEGNIKEAASESDIKKAIDTLIDTNWSGSNSEQMKSVTLLKLLATSELELSNKFMKALDKTTSDMSKDDFK